MPVKDSRKQKLSSDQLKNLIIDLQKWIDSEDFPSLSSFLAREDIRHKYKLSRLYFYDHPEYFSHLLDSMQVKCESYLVKQALAGRAIPSAIFLLKQLQYGGYSDKQELDLNAQVQPIKFVNSVNRPKKS